MTLQQLADLDGVSSVYNYTMPQGDIPLVVVTKKIDRATLQGSCDRSGGCIILTKKDIKDGKDVFALRFLHMQQHAEHIGGKDVLAKLNIKKKDARVAFEHMLRVLLIDLREYMLMPERNEAMQQRLALTLDRIASYSALLSKKEHSWQTHVDNALTALDARDETSLPALYSEIQKLTDKIDKHT